MEYNYKRIIPFIVLVIMLLSNIMPVYAISFEENQIIKLEMDHECNAVLKIQGQDMLKQVFYVFYRDPATGKKYPAFCVEPKKTGVGGTDSYDVTLSLLNDERLWRMLYKGYMGNSYTYFNLECDDDLYYATKTAVHCLVDGTTPKTKYEVPHRVGRSDNISLEEVQRRGAKVLEIAQQIYDYGINGQEKYVTPTISANKRGNIELENINEQLYLVQNYEVVANRDIETFKISINNFPAGTKILNKDDEETTNMNNTSFKIAIPPQNVTEEIVGDINIFEAKIRTYPVFYANAYSEEYQDYITYADSVEDIATNVTLEVNPYQSTIKIIKLEEETEKAIEGVKFNLKYLDNNQEIGEFITDKNGEITINGLRQGKIGITEKETLEDYEIDTDTKEIELEFCQSKEIKIYNKIKKGNLKIIKVDGKDREIKLQGVKFTILNNNDEIIETLITDEKGEAMSSDLPIGEYYIKEIETDEKYILNEEKIEINITGNKINEIVVENEKITGKIKILKTSEDKNNILNKELGSPIEGVKFHIYDEESNFIEAIITNKDGVAISSKLNKGNYIIKEVESGKWYMLNDEVYTAKISENDEIVELNITNKSQDPKVEIEKNCKNTVQANEEIDYEFKISNTGNTNLSNFTWYDILPSEVSRITKIETGTYNQEIIYNIYYKTNKKESYMVVKNNVNSKENNYIDLSNIYLEDGEKITEIKFCFGNVGVGFSNIEQPHIYMKINEDISDNTIIDNYTILEGYNEEYKVSDEDIATAIVYNKIEQKKLPRTGY